MNETLNTILKAAAELEITYGKDGYNAGSVARHLGQSLTAGAIMKATDAAARYIATGKKSGCYTLTATGREAAVNGVTVAAPVTPAQSAPVRTGDYRRTIASDKRLAIGAMFVSGGRQMVVTGHSESTWFLGHARIEAEGLWELDGMAVTYEYYRAATETEIEVAQPVTAAPVVAEVAPLTVSEAGEAVISRINSGGTVQEVSAEQAAQAALIYTRTGGQLGESYVQVYRLDAEHVAARTQAAPYGDSAGPSAEWRVLRAGQVNRRALLALGVSL
jgi:hypothetical protein